MIEWVNDELEAWGRYFRDPDQPLGYPKQSIESRMREGCFGNDQKGKRAADPYVPERVDRMEKAVLRLPDELKMTITVCYTIPGGREFQARVVSKRLDMKVSRDRLNKLIQIAHERIAGFYAGRDWRK